MPPRTRAASGNSFDEGAPEETFSDVITSRNNQWLKKFRAVLHGSGPAENELIGIEGVKLVEEAIRSGLRAEALLISTAGEPNMERILRAASQSEAGIRRERILKTTDQLFAAVAGTETPQGVAALFRQRDWAPEDLIGGRRQEPRPFLEGSALVVVLVAVQDPGNVGTILRSAEAFGATGAVTTRGTADPWSPKALRASAGSALRLPLLRGMAIPVLLALLKRHRLKIVATSAHTATNERSLDPSAGILRGPLAILIGSEGAGLPAEVERASDVTVSIPMSSPVESLNAGIAASLVLYEAARQRKAET